jgi:hypothetical protein
MIEEGLMAGDQKAGEDLRGLCGEAYQAVGVMADRLGWQTMPPDHPWSLPIGKLLDNLAAAVEGQEPPHHDLLPFVLGDPSAGHPEQVGEAGSAPNQRTRCSAELKLIAGVRCRCAGSAIRDGEWFCRIHDPGPKTRRPRSIAERFAHIEITED